jgi:hypothetical protein
LPTSLTYIVLSTRGCSPRRPDAVMSTTERAINLSIGFSRAIESAPDPHEAADSATIAPLSPGNQIPGRADQCQKEKRTLPGARASVSDFPPVAIQYPRPGSGI